jgi:hypothetical protein
MNTIKINDIKDLGSLCSQVEAGEDVQIELQSGAKIVLLLATHGDRTKRIEQLAETLHDGWWEYNVMHGFRLGPRNRDRRTHPHMVPWESLGAESHRQDRFQAELLLKKWETGITEFSAEDIHNAWMEWERLNGNPHGDHMKPFKEVHKVDPWEHKTQAEKLNKIVQQWRR